MAKFRSSRSRARSAEAVDFARQQRREANEFADIVWQWVRNRECFGLKFRREHPIPPYTVDFCCLNPKLIIEVDGKHHFSDDGVAHDARRDAYLNSLGYKILRIPGFDTIRDGQAVRDKVFLFVEDAIRDKR